MDSKIDFKTLLDFSRGKYSYHDYVTVKHWFANGKDDKSTEEKLFNQWQDYAGKTDSEPLHYLFEKVHYRILLEEKSKNKSLWPNLWKAAAVLILAVSIPAWFYIFSGSKQPASQAWVEIKVPDGARVEFILPDSTTGWLNSGAELKYPAEFGPHRKVELAGEGFFKVKHLENSDFTVGVSDMDIKVLGTQFNVAAYANEPVTEVVLKEGKVEVNGKSSKFTRILSPGEKILFDKDKQSLSLRKVDPDLYISWKDGYLVLDNEPLAQAAKKLERWYNADISIQDEKLKTFRFKATFKEEPLEEVLRYIAMTTPITYKIEKRSLNSNGILEKKHVVINAK